MITAWTASYWPSLIAPALQAQDGRDPFSLQPPGLQRSNSEPNMRLMLASPLNSMPQLVFQPAFPAFGSSTTAGALIPYKAPEVSGQQAIALASVVRCVNQRSYFPSPHSARFFLGLWCRLNLMHRLAYAGQHALLKH